MSDSERNKVVRDPVHGYVQIPVELMPVVSLPHVRRLRSISQTANVRAAYPSLNGTRYEHALGTMHLAMKAWDAGWTNLSGGAGVTASSARVVFTDAVFQEIQDAPLDDVDNFTRQYRLDVGSAHARESFARSFESIIRNVVGLCGLLHDVGHSPFSHLLEDLFLHHSGKIFPGALHASYDEYKKNVDVTSKPQFHEYASKELLKSMIREHPSAFKDISTFLLYKVFGARSESSWDRCLHSIIDGQIDVDRLDYVIRDSQRAGVESGSIDSERLLDSIEIHQSQDSGWSIGFGIRAVSSIEGLLEQRVQYYRWVIHHPAALAADTALKRAFGALMSELPIPGIEDAKLRGFLDYVTHWQGSGSGPAPSSFEVDDARVIELLRYKRKRYLEAGHTPSSAKFDLLMQIGVDLNSKYVPAWRNYGEFLEAISQFHDPLADAKEVLNIEIGEEFGGNSPLPTAEVTGYQTAFPLVLAPGPEPEEPVRAAYTDSQLIGILFQLIKSTEVLAQTLQQTEPAVTDREVAIEKFLNENAPKIDGVDGIWLVAVRSKFSAIFSPDLRIWSKAKPAQEIEFNKLSPVYEGLVSSEIKRPLVWPFFIPYESAKPLHNGRVAEVFLDNFIKLVHNN